MVVLVSMASLEPPGKTDDLDTTEEMELTGTVVLKETRATLVHREPLVLPVNEAPKVNKGTLVLRGLVDLMVFPVPAVNMVPMARMEHRATLGFRV